MLTSNEDVGVAIGSLSFPKAKPVNYVTYPLAGVNTYSPYAANFIPAGSKAGFKSKSMNSILYAFGTVAMVAIAIAYLSYSKQARYKQNKRPTKAQRMQKITDRKAAAAALRA